MRIGQMCKQTGVSIDAIRFYERNKLLVARKISEGGFRLYSSDDLSALRFVRSLQTLGFSLHEIREFVSLRTNDVRACSAVRKMLGHKLRDIHEKRIGLAKVEHELKAALTKCNAQLSRPLANKNGKCCTRKGIRRDEVAVYPEYAHWDEQLVSVVFLNGPVVHALDFSKVVSDLLSK